jgi:hypothetical protein
LLYHRPCGPVLNHIFGQITRYIKDIVLSGFLIVIKSSVRLSLLIFLLCDKVGGFAFDNFLDFFIEDFVLALNVLQIHTLEVV